MEMLELAAELKWCRERIAALEAERDQLRDVLWRGGFVMCDIPACNCGSWHHKYGLPERFREIADVLAEAGHELCNENGNLPIRALKSLAAERDRLTACLNAANEQAEHFERQWYLMTDERDQLQDKLADAESSMLRRFDPAAAESTDLFTWITCMLAERDRLKNLVAMAELAIGEHYAPSDCYSTGPLTGGIADHLCPACAFIAVLAAKGE